VKDLDRRPAGHRGRGGRYDAKEERRLFPFWTLIVILGCALIWLAGAKLYQNTMAAYDSYAAIREAVNQTAFFPGVTIDGTDLGGMEFHEAQAMIGERQAQTAQEFSLIIASGDKRWRLTSNEVPVMFNGQTVLERAYAVGRMGTLEERYAQIQHAKHNGVHFTTGFDYDRSAIEGLVRIIGDSLEIEAKDATLDAFDVGKRTFTFSDAQDGYAIDRAKLAEDILAALDAGAYDRVITVSGSTVKPSLTRSQLEGLFGKISSFTTETTKDKDRNTNIELSAAALNGKVVMPGESLSFNSCTGRRSGDKGYREAGAIAGGVLVDDTGGGVCQTSSTLFNAVIRADLKIVERHAHSWPSTYVKKGEDATVNYPSLDFVFKNEGQFPVFVVAWYENRKVTVEIYGQMLENGTTIDLESKVVREIKPDNAILYTLDPTLPKGTRKKGTEKRTGYVVDTYKVYRDSTGAEVKREKMWTTTYPAYQDEILFNDGSADKKE